MQKVEGSNPFIRSNFTYEWDGFVAILFRLRKFSATQGDVAEWLGRGLQNLVQRFDSARRLQSIPPPPKRLLLLVEQSCIMFTY